MVVESGSFAWESDSPPALRDVTLRVSRGSLTAVVGVVGAGKSSLLSALLGELEKLSGRVNVKVRGGAGAAVFGARAIIGQVSGTGASFSVCD